MKKREEKYDCLGKLHFIPCILLISEYPSLFLAIS